MRDAGQQPLFWLRRETARSLISPSFDGQTLSAILAKVHTGKVEQENPSALKLV